jgi:hypothetical protein
MRVRLVAHIISHSVAASIIMHVSLGVLPLDANITAQLIKNTDGLFD